MSSSDEAVAALAAAQVPDASVEPVSSPSSEQFYIIRTCVSCARAYIIIFPKVFYYAAQCEKMQSRNTDRMHHTQTATEIQRHSVEMCQERRTFILGYYKGVEFNSLRKLIATLLRKRQQLCCVFCSAWQRASWRLVRLAPPDSIRIASPSRQQALKWRLQPLPKDLNLFGG